MAKVKDFLIHGKWNCIKCGACCSHVTPLVNSGKLPKSFQGEHGKCSNLGNDNLCTIYDSRPDICRIDKTIGHLPDKEIAQMCKSMKDYKEKLDGYISLKK